LTWNGITPNLSTALSYVSVIAQAKTLLDVLHTDYPNAKVVIISPQLPSLNGGMGASYGATAIYSDTFGNVRSIFGLNLAYEALKAETGYSDYIEHINLAGQFDSENNMPEADVAVNSRSSKTEKRGTNGVHPATNGYYQIADAVYRSIHKKIQEV
jgi:lysophospholipase L1-like esterase